VLYHYIPYIDGVGTNFCDTYSNVDSYKNGVSLIDIKHREEGGVDYKRVAMSPLIY